MSDETPNNALISTLLQLADDHKDKVIADELRRVAVAAQQYPNMPSSAAMQHALWSAEDVVYKKLDRILALCESNGAVVTEAFAKSMDSELAIQEQARRIEQALAQREAADAAHIGAIQEVTTAVRQLRSEFQPVAETVNEIADDVAVLKNNWLIQEQRNRQVDQELGEHRKQLVDHAAQIAQHTEDIAELKRYAVRMNEEIRQQLADVLARLPMGAINRSEEATAP